MLSVSCGLVYGWPSAAIPKLLSNGLDYDINHSEVSYIVILTPFGYILGTPLIAILLDKIGRKISILILAVPQICAWILIAYSSTAYSLYVARIIAGISEGGAFTAIPIYICEISEPAIRGALGNSFTVALVSGIFLINCYGSYISLRSSAYISISIPLLFLVTFIWMPESPYYLLMKGKLEKARSSLRWLRHIRNVDDELVRLTADVERQMSEPSSIKAIFSIRSNLKAFLILMGLRTAQHFTGGAYVSFYNQVIFQRTEANVSATTSSIIFHFMLFFVSLCAITLVDCFGRKPLLMVSAGVSSVAFLAEGIYFYYQYYEHDVSSFHWVPITALLSYTVVRGSGLLSIPTLMAGELLSASVKSKVVALVNI